MKVKESLMQQKSHELFHIYFIRFVYYFDSKYKKIQLQSIIDNERRSKRTIELFIVVQLAPPGTPPRRLRGVKEEPLPPLNSHPSPLVPDAKAFSDEEECTRTPAIFQRG